MVKLLEPMSNINFSSFFNHSMLLKLAAVQKGLICPVRIFRQILKLHLLHSRNQAVLLKMHGKRFLD